MKLPDDKNRSPADRFHRILTDGQKKESVVETRKSSVINLPRAKMVEQDSAAERSVPPARPEAGFRFSRDRLLPAFWTVASIVSLTVNAILLVALVMMLRGLGGLNATGMGTGLLGGLYTNFERMDQAHIRTTIPVQASVPLNMSIPVQTTTAITLAQDVSIRGAHVKIDTPLFNIDAPADVTLPAGTALNVALNFNVPVQSQVPVLLNVPVDIAMQDTELHPAIIGLQSTLRPLYCIVNPAAMSLSGGAVCR
jgi:hypothetical protein